MVNEGCTRRNIFSDILRESDGAFRPRQINRKISFSEFDFRTILI